MLDPPSHTRVLSFLRGPFSLRDEQKAFRYGLVASQSNLSNEFPGEMIALIRYILPR